MSDLSKAVTDYLSLRRRLGYKLQDPGTWLPNFVSFFGKEGASHITTDLALRWAMIPGNAQPSHWAARLRAVRLFAEYYKTIDPRTEIPPLGLLPHRPRRKQPHIYSEREIRGLIEAAAGLGSTTGLRPHTHQTLIGLLAVTGMRVGEALALDQDDVDFAQGVVVIRKAKLDKTRLVPIHPTTQMELRKYASHRDRTFEQPTTPSLFRSDRGTRLEISCAYRTFVDLSRKIGLRGPSDRHGPRFQDLRHTFAVRTVIDWYRKGMDVSSELPKLSTYLGHTHVSDTYWYLTAVPELMQLAATRLEGKGGEIT
jgi:integrase